MCSSCGCQWIRFRSFGSVAVCRWNLPISMFVWTRENNWRVTEWKWDREFESESKREKEPLNECNKDCNVRCGHEQFSPFSHSFLFHAFIRSHFRIVFYSCNSCLVCVSFEHIPRLEMLLGQWPKANLIVNIFSVVLTHLKLYIWWVFFLCVIFVDLIH